MIAGEEISLVLENEEKIKMPVVLATFLMNNGLARRRFHELSQSKQVSFIKRVKDAKALHLQLEISMKFLGKVVV